MLNKDSIIEKMNRLGHDKTPFLFIIDFEQENGFIIEDAFNQDNILFSLNSISNSPTYSPLNNSINPIIKPYPKSFEEYNNQFEIVNQALMNGDSFLANLTIKTKIDINLSLEEIFHRANSKYKLYIKDKLVSFSPESFVKIKDNKISTYPMKGTIDASIPNAEQTILNDYKETCEHNTIVDLMRNDLNIIASNVRVERFRYIDKLQTSRGDILQVSSEIVGDLDKDFNENLGNIISKLLPAGSISGAPKTSTINIIQSSEKEKRGFYTGIFGFFDGKDLDSAVIIRYIEKENDNYYFRSGGGLTINSNPEEEYKEAINKIYLPF
ncbi:MAG: aminodeoxychorismate synthase component I [Bacteroidales bacterium]|nr:aminodeoxychorismate synthase component I [Bacteroidales bacterium]MDD4685430.1 aminodeoxychorismate synthase component I [Bacteroidales bacterium]